MTPPPVEKALLAALSQGMPPHAEALECDDLRGPFSLFGESFPMPRPIRDFSPELPLYGDYPAQARAQANMYSQCKVLWESADAAMPHTLAQTLIAGEARTANGKGGLAVPAPTYLAGRVTSSFALAWQLLQDGYFPEWSAVLCSCQTAGRGQLRRAWHSPRGNLHVTFRLPRSAALQGDAASLVTGYLLVKAFRALGFPLQLKWPNDLLLEQQCKVGGILLEERDGVLLAGMGINLAEAPQPSMLRDGSAVRVGVLLRHHAERERQAAEAGIERRAVQRDDTLITPFFLWKRLACQIILEYAGGIREQGLPYVLANLNSPPGPRCRNGGTGGHSGGKTVVYRGSLSPLLAWQGKRVILNEGATGTAGRYTGLGPGGGLLLTLANGKEREFFSGSLSLAEQHNLSGNISA